MGHDNLDKNIRNTLADRNIQPSTAAWDKLEAMLDSEEKKQPKRKLIWYYVAASIVLLISISLVYFGNTQEEFQVSDEMVNTDTKNETEMNNEINSDTSENKLEEVVAIVPEAETPITPVSNKEVLNNNKVASVNKDKVKQEKYNNKEINIVDHQQNHETVIANTSIETDIDNEVEALLAVATTKIKEEKEILNTTENSTPTATATISVDPDELLMEVEATAEESLRAKIFEKLKEGFKKTKTAVATRND